MDVQILCNNNDIVLSIDASSAFSGMIYPKGLSKNSSCLADFTNQINPVLYKLPLKSCNTMSTELDDGIEYFNTIVVQPHRKLVTNQGRGYHVRCKYLVEDRVVSSNFNVRFPWSGGAQDRDGASALGTTPLTAT